MGFTHTWSYVNDKEVPLHRPKDLDEILNHPDIKRLITIVQNNGCELIFNDKHEGGETFYIEFEKVIYSILSFSIINPNNVII